MENFETRKKNLFECLDDAAKSLVGTNLYQQKPPENLCLEIEKVSTPTTTNDKNRIINKLRGKDSIFKKPELPLQRCLKPRHEPDYKVNPHKWKKYSLADVDISDKTNSSAAFNFLKEIEEWKEVGDDQVRMNEDMKSGQSKVVFRKSKHAENCLESILPAEETTEDKSHFKGSKLVMPQYTIGQKPEGRKRKRSEKKTDEPKPQEKLKLTHLMEDEEDCGDKSD